MPEDAATRRALAAAITQTEGGDPVVIANDDPVALAQGARGPMDEVFKVPGQPRLRIALHYREVRTYQRETDLRRVIAGGDAILCASRVEPIVEPGEIWATDASRASAKIT